MAARDLLKAIAAAVIDALLRSTKQQGEAGPSRSKAPRSTSQVTPRLRAQRPKSVPGGQAGQSEGSPGQYGVDSTRDMLPGEIERLRPSYEPNPDGDPDPGEIVWTWVPYAENDGRGKDRPVLIISRTQDGATAGCYLSTKEHRGFISVGTGAWDSQGRESFLSPERILRVTESGMRREGHVVPRERFVAAVKALSRMQPIQGTVS